MGSEYCSSSALDPVSKLHARVSELSVLIVPVDVEPLCPPHISRHSVAQSLINVNRKLLRTIARIQPEIILVTIRHPLDLRVGHERVQVLILYTSEEI